MIRIREELPSDVDAIDQIQQAAFAAEPHSSQTEHLIVRALRRRGRLAVSLVAEVDGRAVGHIALSPVSISDGAAEWYGLGPLGVLPPYQRRGIGARLTRDAIERLRALDARGCVVVGEPAFYGKFGFKADRALVFPDVPAAYFQALRLVGPPARGQVTYDEAFAAA